MLKNKSLLLYKRLLTYTYRYRTILFASLFAIMLAGIFEAGLFALLKPILDEGFLKQDVDFIKFMPWLIIGAFLIMSLFGFIGNVGMQWIAQKVVKTLREEMLAKLLTLPMVEYDKKPTGAFLSKLTYDVTQLLTISSFALVTLIKDSATILGLLAVMFYQSWKISLIVFLIAPIIAFVLKKVSKRLRRLSHSVQNQMGELNHVVEETIRGHREIKLFNAHKATADRFNNVNKKLQQLNVKIMIASELASPITQLMVVLCVAVVISYASNQVLNNVLTPGAFLALLAAMVGLLNPIKRLTRLNESLQRGLAGAESIFELIDAPIEPTLEKGSELNVSGRIEFKHVDFTYPNTHKKALNDINLVIEPYETIALVGASGSGKTTFANLLARFYQPDAGEIFIDDMNLAALNIGDYRAHISYVSQNVVLFADTIANNIALGQSDLSFEAIKKAAIKANAWEFIEAMPDQLDTLIGENGARLSGGQRQRIAIARALLKNATILIFDEATSSLDTESEFYIQEAIAPLSKDKTTIIIAHRLSTIEQADRIIVFDQGRIVESGSHQDLLDKNNIYAKLYRIGNAFK